MSDEQTQEVEEPTVTPEQFAALAEEVKNLQASRDRILAESKEWKQKAQSLRSEKEQSEREVLEKNGEVEKLLELERNKNHELYQTQSKMQKEVLRKELNFQVAQHASDAKKGYLEDVLTNVTKMSDVVSIDQENLKIDGVAEAVALLRQRKPDLFNTGKSSGMADSRPAADIPKEKSFGEMTKAEQDADLTALLKQTF